jgi:hypothetical protein
VLIPSLIFLKEEIQPAIRSGEGLPKGLLKTPGHVLTEDPKGNFASHLGFFLGESRSLPQEHHSNSHDHHTYFFHPYPIFLLPLSIK